MPAPLQWIARPAAPAEFLHSLSPELSPLVGQLLWGRSLTDADQIAAFFNTSYDQLHNPLLLRDMDRAVARIARAVSEGQRVAVYGDFDTDGVTGVTLLTEALGSLGLDVLPYIPKRLTEGYGLNTAAVERLAGEVGLLITVDCGVSNVAEISRANELGLDVVVLDHHQPPAVLPPAYALVNPKRADCPYPYKQLAGVGVAFKLIQALHKAGLKTPYRARDFLDIVALGTVTDMMPLSGENRVLVKYGLAAMNATERPGLRALIEAAGIKGTIDAGNISFSLGPRINAAGRMDDAAQAFDLLRCPDAAAARPLAEALNALNLQRQQLTASVQAIAEELVVSSGQQDSLVITLAGDEFPAGIVGLVAGKLAEAFRRPVLVMEQGAETSRGSARSISGFSIVDALTECGGNELFEKFGGHSMAAGFTIRNDRLALFQERLLAIAARILTPELLAPKLQYDAELPLRQVTCDLVDQVAELAPFGQGNPEPLWVSRGVIVASQHIMGGERQHLKLRLHDGRGLPLDALMWGQAARAAEFPVGARLDVAYRAEINEWNGSRKPQLMIRDVRVVD